MMQNVFVTGNVGVGKSTLLRRIIDKSAPSQHIYGFCTEKISPDGKHGDTGKVYIYPASGKCLLQEQYCFADMLGRQHFYLHADVFDTVGIALLSDIPYGSIVMMDELGFLESSSTKFCDKVMEILSGDYLVLGAVKPRRIPFLNAVREHSKTALYEVTEQNRDNLFSEIVLKFENLLSKTNYPNGSIRK